MSEVMTPPIRIDDTMTPCMVAENSPNVSLNEAMVVTGPIVPVSSLPGGE